MGDPRDIFRGVDVALVSLSAIGRRNPTNAGREHATSGMDTRPLGEKAGGGIPGTRGPLGEVVAMPSCGGSQRAIFALEIGRNPGRETDFADPSFRTSA